MAIDSAGLCWSCSGKLRASDMGNRGECPSCGRDTHVCYNCQFHDSKSYNECLESEAERVVEKDRSNYCDFFQPKSAKQGQARANTPQDLRSAAEALFKKR